MADASGRGRLRVVTMVDRLMTSGAEIFATQVATALDPLRFDSIVCSTRASAPADIRAVEQAGVRVIALDRRSTVDVVRWRTLLRLLHNERVDILHSHKHGSNVWAAALGRLARVPVVVAHEHSWTYAGQPLRRLLDRHLVARFADVVLATSENHWRHMVAVQGIRPTKARYLPNAVPPLGTGDGAAARRDLGIPADAPLIGTVCTLRPEKAVEVLLDAAALLRRDVPSLQVVIVGDGPERPRLEARAADLGLGGLAHFAGRRPRHDLANLLDALDVAVLTSDFEATPLTLLEFMAAAKPIVATRVGGIPGLVEDAVEAILVPPRDPSAVADAVRALLADPRRRSELGARARQRQRDAYDFEAMVRSLEQLYESLYLASTRHRDATGSTPAGRASV